ncbi:hypothetical protein CROQUDRAFT_53166 [Cronartium quercuum f. sp. fusiforme G11]|uniref:N-acetyltransferase domain-containing protein n=1 Tax=Cronartium quercuum f. sp. fusiforme G11 TaxID=708437 RepID=A0A9P6NA67_9BASI|nr:hypothetical protein CROQUDRAFT_53166 [Cronartium quercuum f. sp. fusiforme G11]
MASKSQIVYDPVKPTELNRVVELESEAFPPDEAASLETIEYRHKHAPELFLGAYNPSGQLISYINATRSTSSILTHESLTTHQPEGTYVLIHSVCVDVAYRRKGVAKGLLKHYIETCKGSCTALVLVCHPELKALYLAVGFEEIGQSSLVHGQRPWWEMRLDLNPVTPALEAPISNPTDLICPVAQCGCVILKSGVGRLIEKETSPVG